MKGYSQLTQEERYQIYSFKKAGWTQSEIAQELGVHKSTISREMQRDAGRRGYRPRQAHTLAVRRRQERPGRRQISAACWARVEAKLREEWSPDQITRRLGSEEGLRVSHESIYRYIYADKRAGGTLHHHLRCQKKRRKRYGSGRQRRGQIPDRRCISTRPEVIEQRLRLGDWEADTIVGKNHQQALVSLTERNSRYTILVGVERATAEAVGGVIVSRLKKLGVPVWSITSDNGKEFAAHLKIAHALQTDFYFAHPYCPWERGTNENTNGLVRQYFPKKSKFAELTAHQVEAVMNKLNHRPRKALGYRTPHEVLYGHHAVALHT